MTRRAALRFALAGLGAALMPGVATGAPRRISSIGNREYAEAGGLVGHGADDRAPYVRGASAWRCRRR